MLKRVSAFLRSNPGTKAKTIASNLGVERSEVNRLLHDHVDLFEKDEEFRWSLVPTAFRIEFTGGKWLGSWHFEKALKDISPLDSRQKAVVFVLSDESKPLVAFLARLLALSNQLVAAGTAVTLDLTMAKSTRSYLDRVGFFGILDDAIDVHPQRPAGELAKTYQGNNDGVIEFRLIDPANPDQDIPNLLRNSFVRCAGPSYSKAAFTVLAELFGNVVEHSKTSSPGFACLQHYKNGKKIQAVISDNGQGIVGTLGPVIPKRYPAVQRIIEAAEHSGVALLTEVFKRGQLSQVNEDGRGLGLKRSGDVAEKFRANITVRQSDFELGVHHNHDGTQFSHRLGLARLEGTHICFEFKLDAPHNSA